MNSYRFLPFRFQQEDSNVLLVNDVGEYHFLEKDTFKEFISYRLDVNSEEFLNLKSKFMAFNNNLPETINLLATRYRTKKQFLFDFTSLHMFVVTLRCNQKCNYCHSSSVDETGFIYDMDSETARNAVKIAFNSPSPYIKIEFQGGEPLLNFKIVREIVEYAKEINETYNKEIEFVLCSNLIALKQEHIDFFKDNNIYVSTSLDGPEEIHDKHRRLRTGKGTYKIVNENLSWIKNQLGKEKISALLTVTPFSLTKLKDVVDEYLKQELDSIFIRMIDPFGYAGENWKEVGYTTDSFLKEYEKILEYIISLNLNNIHFPESYATLLLTKILTPFSTGFVDLQSPAGTGISGVIYDTNGDVYVSDEARMYARTSKNKYFCIGNVNSNSWAKMFGSEKLRNIISASCIEALPGCAWCVYQPYCGSDPIRNYALHNNMMPYKKNNEFCQKHKYIFNLLFNYLKNNNEIEDVFWSWITQRTLDEVRGNYLENENI